jgi:hypothetical protein
LNAVWLFDRFFFPGSFQVFEEKKPEDWRKKDIDTQEEKQIAGNDRKVIAAASASSRVRKRLRAFWRCPE